MVYVYLDQNKMIDLAKAFHKREDGKPFKDALEHIMHKVKDNEWIVPLSVVHLMETAAIGDEARRARFSKFLIEISKMNTMNSYLSVEGYEILNAYLRAANHPTINIKDKVFGKDILHLIDLDLSKISIRTETEELANEIRRLIKEYSENERILEYVLSKDVLSGYRETQYAEWQESAKEQEDIRKELMQQVADDVQRYRHIIANGYDFKKKIHSDLLVSSLSQEDLPRIRQAFKTDTDAFLSSISTLYVQAKLTLQRYKDQSKSIHRNDIKDISFLSVAIPYCDIVVTERSWRHMAIQARLDQCFRTRIVSDVRDLIEIK